MPDQRFEVLWSFHELSNDLRPFALGLISALRAKGALGNADWSVAASYLTDAADVRLVLRAPYSHDALARAHDLLADAFFAAELGPAQRIHVHVRPVAADA